MSSFINIQGLAPNYLFTSMGNRPPLGQAAEGGDLETLRCYMPLNEEFQNEAIICAARGGQYRSVEFLLSDGRPLNEEALGLAVRETINGLQVAGESFRTIEFREEESLSVIKCLLSQGRVISSDDLKKAIIKAAQKGLYNIIDYLLSEGRVLSNADLDDVKENVQNDVIANLLESKKHVILA